MLLFSQRTMLPVLVWPPSMTCKPGMTASAGRQAGKGQQPAGQQGGGPMQQQGTGETGARRAGQHARPVRCTRTQVPCTTLCLHTDIPAHTTHTYLGRCQRSPHHAGAQQTCPAAGERNLSRHQQQQQQTSSQSAAPTLQLQPAAGQVWVCPGHDTFPTQ